MFVQLISQTDWTEVKKQEGESQFLFLIREKLPVIFRHFIQNSWRKWRQLKKRQQTYSQHGTEVLQKYANWCTCFKDMCHWMQWPCLLSQMINQVVVCIARWCHFVL